MYMIVVMFFVFDLQSWDESMVHVLLHCMSGLHRLFQRCVHVCLRFAVDVGSSGVCMFHVLILMFILVLNCEVLLASLDGLGPI